MPYLKIPNFLKKTKLHICLCVEFAEFFEQKTRKLKRVPKLQVHKSRKQLKKKSEKEIHPGKNSLPSCWKENSEDFATAFFFKLRVNNFVKKMFRRTLAVLHDYQSKLSAKLCSIQQSCPQVCFLKMTLLLLTTFFHCCKGVCKLFFRLAPPTKQ